MSKLYGWGAAVVIIGALFKINHWPGGTIMLIIGMGTETVIFFLSAFEPPHVEFDWTLVYPQLAGMEDSESLSNITSGDEVDNLVSVPESSDPLTSRIDKMLEDANITPELIERLGSGMNNLAESAQAMNGMAQAAASTDKFVSSLDGAADAVNNLRHATEAVNTLTTIYQETAQALTSGDASYADEMKKLAGSLASVNAMYEMQLQTSTSQLESTKEIEERIHNMMVNFADSAEGVLKYKDQVDALTRKVAELNNVYGNMLAAMQTRL
ncbi:MAG: gliding motility protein GldL [Bacteroidales bacterium]|nr:gliding motility protein GldL [Bacteroidales bacterium]MBR3411758.1 gliding motility protein GldL [Bacteroidales bacterium]